MSASQHSQLSIVPGTVAELAKSEIKKHLALP
jgi:hypothetical protein